MVPTLQRSLPIVGAALGTELIKPWPSAFRKIY